MNSSILSAERLPAMESAAEYGPRRSARIANVERLRILAIFEIIGFHAATERTLFFGGVGLATFLILTNLFNTTVSNKRGFTSFAKAKIHRLLWPWLFWCGVYAVWIAFHAYRHGQPLSGAFSPWMLLYGTKEHLWFVPFALVSGVTVGWFQHSSLQWRDGPLIAACAILGGAILLISSVVTTYCGGLHIPIPQYLYALPSTFIGFALGRSVLIQDPVAKRRALGGLCIGAAVYGAAFLALVQVVPLHYMVLRYAVMVIVISGAIVCPGREDTLTRLSIPLMFGVYLIHPLIVEILYRFDVLHRHILLYALVVFVLSNLAIWTMQRTKLRRFT